MTFLIDTHILIWTAVRPRQVPSWASTLMEDTKNSPVLSAASVYEIALKVNAGKLPGVELFERKLLRNIADMGITILELSPVVMLRAARLVSEHKDPFDRMIAAQAIESDLELLSVDPLMKSFGVRLLRGPAA